MDRNSNQFPRHNNQPKMPRFNMNWIYIIVLIGLAVLFFTGGGDSLAQAAGTSKDAKYSDFKTYVEKGYAQRIVVNKNDNTLKMYVKPKYIQNVFQQTAQQTGNDPYVNVEFGSVDELDKYLAAEQAKGKFASYSYDNAKTSDIMSLIINLSPLIIFFVLMWFIGRRMGGGTGGTGGVFSVGKSKAKLYEKAGEL